MSTTGRPSCSTRSGTRTWWRTRRAESPSTSARTRSTPRSTARNGRSRSSTPPVTRRSRRCAPAERGRPTWSCSWSPPTTALSRRPPRRSTTPRREACGRVRALLAENGDQVGEAPPSRPVQVLGLTAVPGGGDSFLVVDDDRVARQIAERREARERSAMFAQRRPRVPLEDLESALKSGEREELLLIIKGDVSGSVEALEDALVQLDVGEEVVLRVIGRGVGAITQDDVNLAIASEAVIVGFNVRPAGRAGELAQREGVDIRYYTIIYQAIEEIEAALKGMLKPQFEEGPHCTAEIREIFRVPRIGNVAGCIVRSGTITR